MKLLAMLRLLKPPKRKTKRPFPEGWTADLKFRTDPRTGQTVLDLPDDEGGANDGQGGYYDPEVWEDQ